MLGLLSLSCLMWCILAFNSYSPTTWAVVVAVYGAYFLYLTSELSDNDYDYMFRGAAHNRLRSRFPFMGFGGSTLVPEMDKGRRMIHRVDISLSEFPGSMAYYFSKYAYECSVIGWAVKDRVRMLNHTTDNRVSSVSYSMSDVDIINAAKSHGADTVVLMHSHVASRRSTAAARPSPHDLSIAKSKSNQYTAHGINLVEYVTAGAKARAYSFAAASTEGEKRRFVALLKELNWVGRMMARFGQYPDPAYWSERGDSMEVNPAIPAQEVENAH